MLLPRKQRPQEEAHFTPHSWDWQANEYAEERPRNAKTQLAECSKISAKMVDLSLREAQRDPIFAGTIESNSTSGLPPVPTPSRDVQRIPASKVENTELGGTHVHSRPSASRISNSAALYSWAKVRLRGVAEYSLRSAAKGRGLLSGLTVSKQRTPVSIRGWMGMLAKRAPVVYAALQQKVESALRYRCRDCAREVGCRSHPRNFVEHYVLPLLLLQPVRCVECFRRDYWPILTPVRKHSRHHHSNLDHQSHKAA